MAVIYDYREFFRYVRNYNKQTCDVRENIVDAYFQVAALGLPDIDGQRRLLDYGAREVGRAAVGI